MCQKIQQKYLLTKNMKCAVWRVWYARPIYRMHSGQKLKWEDFMLNFSVDDGMIIKTGKRARYMEKIRCSNNEIK